MKINNKTPAVMVFNIHLRKALIEALRKSKYKIDKMYVEDKININNTYGSFVLDDAMGRGAGFATFHADDTYYTWITIEQMFEILTPTFVPVEVELNSAYTAIIQENGDIEVGCQTISASNFRKLVVAFDKVTKI